MKNIFFRALEPEDALQIHQWRNNFELMKNAVGINRYTSLQENQKWVSEKMNHDPFNVFWAICQNDATKKMIGYTCLTNIHYINSSANCGAIVLDPQSCDGISWIEAQLLVLEYTFETLHLNRLTGSALDIQQITIAGMELLFFQKEGTGKKEVFKNGKYHDVFHYAILKEDYLLHKKNADYEISSILKRIRGIRKK